MKKLSHGLKSGVLMAVAGGFPVIATALAAGGAESGMKLETVTIRNPACEAVISTAPFVHLISFRLTGGRNHLIGPGSPNPIKNGIPERPDFIFGAKFWYAPEVAGSHRFGMLAGKVTQTGTDVDAQLEVDPEAHLQGKIHFHLDPKLPQLTICSSLRNVGSVKTEKGIWWPVSFEQGGRMEAKVLPLPAEPNASFHFWAYGGPPSDPACQIGKASVVLDLDRHLQYPVYKIGFLGREISVVKPDCTYRITALDPAPDAQRAYPHGNSPIMLFRQESSLFCEAELSGPLVKLQPGDETSYTFSITLDPPGNRE